MCIRDSPKPILALDAVTRKREVPSYSSIVYKLLFFLKLSWHAIIRHYLLLKRTFAVDRVSPSLTIMHWARLKAIDGAQTVARIDRSHPLELSLIHI